MKKYGARRWKRSTADETRMCTCMQCSDDSADDYLLPQTRSTLGRWPKASVV